MARSERTERSPQIPVEPFNLGGDAFDFVDISGFQKACLGTRRCSFHLSVNCLQEVALHFVVPQSLRI